MARFTDQFDRHNPKSFRPSMPIATWPTLVHVDALELLSDVDADAFDELAIACEQAIEEQASPWNFPLPEEFWLHTRVLPSWVNEQSTASTTDVRNTYSDLNLLLNAIEYGSQPAIRFTSQKFESWHYLASFAIWKLIDAFDVMYGHAPQYVDGLISPKSEFRVRQGASLAMEAQAAISNAQQLKERARHVEEMRIATEAWEKQKRTARASIAGYTRSEFYRAAGDKALEIVKAMNKRFVNADRQAEAVHAVLPIEYQSRCTVRTVKKWLREREWKRKK